MPFLQIKRNMSKCFFNSLTNEEIDKILEIVQIRIQRNTIYKQDIFPKYTTMYGIED